MEDGPNLRHAARERAPTQPFQIPLLFGQPGPTYRPDSRPVPSSFLDICAVRQCSCLHMRTIASLARNSWLQPPPR